MLRWLPEKHRELQARCRLAPLPHLLHYGRQVRVGRGSAHLLPDPLPGIHGNSHPVRTRHISLFVLAGLVLGSPQEKGGADTQRSEGVPPLSGGSEEQRECIQRRMACPSKLLNITGRLPNITSTRRGITRKLPSIMRPVSTKRRPITRTLRVPIMCMLGIMRRKQQSPTLNITARSRRPEPGRVIRPGSLYSSQKSLSISAETGAVHELVWMILLGPGFEPTQARS